MCKKACITEVLTFNFTFFCPRPYRSKRIIRSVPQQRTTPITKAYVTISKKSTRTHSNPSFCCEQSPPPPPSLTGSLPTYNANWPIKGQWRCFCKKIWKNKTKSVGTKPTTNSHPTNRWQSNWHQNDWSGSQLLPSSSLAPGCTATSRSFGCLSGLTVSKHTLYKKNEYEKVNMKPRTASNQRPREKDRASIWTGARPNCAPRRNRYTTSE